MRPLFWVYLAALLIWLLTMSFCHKAGCNCTPAAAAAGAVVAPITEDEVPLRSIALMDEDRNYNAALYDNLLFSESDCMYESPISDSLSTVFQSLATHLQDNRDRILVLSGLYQSAETNNCSADDLGLGRAESVRQLLVDKGAPSDQIRLRSDNQNILDMVDDKIMGGVTYSFINGDLTAVEDRLRNSNITLYFGTNQRDIFLDAEQVKYFDDLKFFLNQKPDASAVVRGHTDDKGSASGNKRLSRKRAEFVRDFMIDKGIDSDQISHIGVGPDEPIATNDTEEGRAKNRRVEISIE